MERADELVRILKEEYGIENLSDLKKAISRLEKVDLTPFCQIPACVTGKEIAS